MIKAAAVAAGALAIVATVTPVFAQGKEFPDVPPDHWAAQSVKLLEDRGIVIGYPDGTYGGPKAMTRYEFAEAIARLLPQIDQRIAEAIAKIPQPDLSQYVTKTDLDTILGDYAKKTDLDNYYTKAEADQRFATKADIDRIMGLLNQFRDELTALGVDVNALKRHYAALEARVTQLEKLQVFGASTAALKVSNQFDGVPRGQQYAGVDEGGSLLDNGSRPLSTAGIAASQLATPVPLPVVGSGPSGFLAPPSGELGAAGNAQGKHGVLSDPSAFYDTQIGIQYAITPRLRAVAQFIMGNYYGAWNEQQAFNASFNDSSDGLLALRSNRQTGSLALQTYEAYLTSPFTLPIFPHAITNNAVSVGRIPTKMTPFTWWAVDPDPYINIEREDDGNITLTGGAVSGQFKNWSVNIFGGYQPTDGTSPYTFASELDPSRDGTIGFGHYVRPGGSQTFGLNYDAATRTHLDPNYYHIPTLTSVAGVRFSLPYIGINYLVGTGDDWNDPGLQLAPAGAGGLSAPLFNRFGSVWSVDWSTALPANRISSFFPKIGFQGELAHSNTNNWGAFGVQTSGAGVPSSAGSGFQDKLTFPIGSVNFALGAESISPGFQAPGSWGSLGSWINPWNITTDSPVYAKGGRGSNQYQIPIIPTELTIAVPLNNVPLVGAVAFNLNAGVGHMIGNTPGFATPVGPTAPLVDVSDPSQFRISHASMGVSVGAGKHSGWKFGLASDDVLRDYPASGGFKRDVTFLWDALKNLVNVRGGTGAHQIAPNAALASTLPEFGPGSQLGPIVTAPGPAGIQSDENYYQFSIGKNLTRDGSALAKLLFQRIVYTDRTGNDGGSYRGDVGAVQVTYKF